MGDIMKKNSIKILATVMSLFMLWESFSPLAATAASDNAHTKGLQNFFDEGTHSQLVDCSDAVYMEYAEQLRTNRDAALAMNVLGLIYGTESEPTKEQYMQALVNIMKTYEDENAAALTQQNQLDNTKELKDYLFDVVDIEMGLLNVSGAWDAMKEEARIALSGITQTLDDIDDWSKGVAVLETTLQNYEKYDLFLQLVQNNADGALKAAASELRTALSEVMKTRLSAYGDLLKGSAEKGALVFKDAIFDKEWMDQLKSIDVSNVSTGYKWLTNIDIFFLETLPWISLGVDIGKLLGNLSVGVEDVLSYVIEIKAVHDISVVLECELENTKNTFQKDSTKVTETDAQNYIAYGNYLISSRLRGQYCMSAIYLQCPSLRALLGDNAAKNAETLYNRLTSNLLNIKKKLDAICSGTNLTPVLSGIEADSIQYYNCSESGNFAVIEKNGKCGIIDYDGEMLLPIEYDEIYQGRGHSYDYLWASKGDYFYSIDVNGKAEESWGYPGGDVDPGAYWYNGQLAVFMPAEGVIGGLEELSWIAIEQRSWEKNAVLPIQEMSGVKQENWGPMAQVDNSNYALLDTSTGKLVSDFIYSGYDTGNGFSEGVLAVKKGDKWGFIDANGNEITDFLYDPYEQNDSYEDAEYKYSIFTAANGYIAVLKDGKWGLIDTQGNTVVEASYDGISQVNPDGMFWLKENGTWSLYQLGE